MKYILSRFTLFNNTIEVSIMQESINERIKAIADELFNGNMNELCRVARIKQATMSNIVAGRMSKPSFDVINSIIDNIGIDANWLISGKGDMTNKGMMINENKGNTIQNNNGSMVNVSIPSSGTQKIIKPDGTVELQSIDSSVVTSNEVDRLNQRIQDLERIITEKDATIKSKDDMICMMKDMLNKQ